MTINEYITAYRNNRDRGDYMMTQLICNDGFEMSVQASHYHYCSPKNVKGPYSTVEIGFPNEEEELLVAYAEDVNDLTGTVYGYVPIDVVDKVVEKHGGVS